MNQTENEPEITMKEQLKKFAIKVWLVFKPL
ncbi:unnamed protein product, partial [marine sediment metagenome]